MRWSLMQNRFWNVLVARIQLVYRRLLLLRMEFLLPQQMK